MRTVSFCFLSEYQGTGHEITLYPNVRSRFGESDCSEDSEVSGAAYLDYEYEIEYEYDLRISNQ